MSTFDVGLLNNSYSVTDSLNLANPDDAFSFQLSNNRSLKLSLMGLSTPIDWQLKDNIGTILYNGSFSPSSTEAISFANLAAGNYSLQISQTSNDTDYTLKIDSLTGLKLESGFFTVGQTGQVGVDYLIDGGGYQGELAIFSLTGMEAYEPGSAAFIKETARRSLSNSTEGYVVIQDATEGAKFSPTFPWGDNYNSGDYKNIKTFTMKPGDTFGFMLVPNGIVQEVFDNPNIGDTKRPLFSLVTGNPNEAFYVGQIADVTGDGKIFVMEDKRVDTGSDKDYNDVVFRVTGATGKAVKLDNVIDPGKDWRNTSVGDDIRDYINTPPRLEQFHLKSVYQPGEVIKLFDGKVFDENGDLNKVVLSWLKDGNEISTQTIDKSQFTVDRDWKTFSSSWTPPEAGNYQIKAIAYEDETFGKESNPIVQNFRVNSSPINLEFNTSQNLYNAGETVSISAGKVYDADGVADLSKVLFWLRKDNGEWIPQSNISSSFSESQLDSATFNYDLNNLEVGSYQLKAVAYDKSEAASNEVVQSFSIVKKPDNPPPITNTPPQDLQFNLQQSYQYGETINLTDGKVYDANGWNDLNRVKIQLWKDGQQQPDYYATNFMPLSGDNNDKWGKFNYSFNGLAAGDYHLSAIAYDLAGNSIINQVEKNFTIVNLPVEPPRNKAPEALKFSVLPVYTNSETISFKSGQVSDPDGASDIENVYFWLGTLDGKGFGVGDVKQNQSLKADSKNTNKARFDFSVDLKSRNLAPGYYQLWAIAQDKAGNYSTPNAEYFSVITDPGEDELSDSVRLAIADSTNLENYSPEALAKTREWVVWTTPDKYSPDLAPQIGAYDQGSTGYITNTYIWDFPDHLSSEEIIKRLNSLDGIELFYPLAPFEPELLSEPKNEPLVKNPPTFDPNNPNNINVLNSYQWHLRTGVNPNADANITAAWDVPVPGKPTETVRGRNVVIGIVDDGLESTHPDLKDRYLGELSRDFNQTIGLNKILYPYLDRPLYEPIIDNSGNIVAWQRINWDYTYDLDTEPTYSAILREKFTNWQKPINDVRKTDPIPLDVPLTGVLTDLNVFLDVTHPWIKDLEGYLFRPEELKFNPMIGDRSTTNPRGRGGEDDSPTYPVELFRYLNKVGQNFSNTEFDDSGNKSITEVLPSFSGTFKPTGNLGYFNEKWVSGTWNLSLYDAIKSNVGYVNNWELELQTYNPHGTAVAGIAAASGDNGIGGSGVAPLASLAGLRLIADEITDKQIADALSYKNQDIDIYNNSWKLVNPFVGPLNLSTMEKSAKQGRNGLGSIYVFAGGNDRQYGGNVNYNPLANSRYAIAVGAIDYKGEQNRYSYSEPGASLLVSAYSSGGNGAGITTTDLVGEKGYSDNEYTSIFGGTSVAAPLVSGVIALMLEANPNLTWRDVQDALVKTAKQNDPNEPYWTTNGAGYHINHKYGFGAIDAKAAVEYVSSPNWKPLAKETLISSDVEDVNDDIPDGDSTNAVESKILIQKDITVEKVEVLFNTKHKDWGDLRVVLTSPDGTESVLTEPTSDNNPNSVYVGINPKSNWWTFTSVRNWGESSQGEWKLQVFDEKGNEFKGEWNAWKLNIYGTQPTVTITAKDSNAIEDGNAGQFVVTRTGDTDKPLTVNYSIAGNAINGIDYKTLSGSVTIPVGATIATIPIIPLADAEVEGNETVKIGLIDNAAYNLGTDKSGTVTIENRSDISQYGPFVHTNPANGHLYILSQPDTWLGAQEQAKTLGGNLVTVNNAAENNWLVNTFGKNPLWIGLTDSSIYGTTEGNFKWVSGEPVTYTNWDAGNPDNVKFTPEGENFVHINQGVGGTWNDLTHNYFVTYGIIEIDPATLTKPIVTIRATDAKAGEDGNAGQLIVTRIGNTTNPLTVNYSVFGNAINGTDYRNLTGNITISAGASVASIPIIPIADNEVEGDETVAVKLLANAAYNVAPSETATVTIANSNTSSINPIIYSNPATGHRYFLTTDDTWLGAQEQAKAAGGNLVAISDAAENAWLVNTFTGGYKWMGLTDSPIYNATEGNYKWVSGEPINYINWYPLEPNNTLDTPEGEDFSEFRGNGLWNDMPSQQNWIRQGIVEIPAPIPTNNWNARFINRTSANIADRTTYDFSNPTAILDLGNQHQGSNDGSLRLYQNWGDGSPTNGVQTDNFAMEAWTRTNFEVGKLYKITTQSDDGIWFRAKNVQTGQWTGDSVVLGDDGGDWRDRSTAMPPRTIFFKVPESGEYDFYVQYYERAIGAVVDIKVEEAKVFQDSVNESQRWESTVFWWDRKLGNVPPGDFYNSQNNVIGVVDQGSNTRSDGKKGIEFSDVEYESLNNDVRLPDDHYAIRSYTQTNLEAGVKYRAKVLADDGFQLLTKRANTNQWVYITPKDQWQRAYGGTTVDFEVSQNGLYDMYFNYYEQNYDTALDLSWEVVPFTGRLLATTTTNIRSGPGTNYSIVGTIPFDGTSKTVTFDKWTNGGFVDYTAELGTSSDIWYRIAGTNQWISAAIVGQKQYDSTTSGSGSIPILVGTVIPEP